MNYNDLTDEQQEEFVDLFYDKYGFSDLEEDEPCAEPWGAPWYWCNDEISSENSVEELVIAFVEKYVDHYNEMKAISDEENEAYKKFEIIRK